MTLLGPAFLIRQIPTFSMIMGAVVLVIFSDTINRYIVFPVADLLKHRTHTKVRNFLNRKLSLFASESVATIIFIIYCWLGGVVLAEFVFAPILNRSKDVLILVLLGAFLLISYVINSERKRFLKV